MNIYILLTIALSIPPDRNRDNMMIGQMHTLFLDWSIKFISFENNSHFNKHN